MPEDQAPVTLDDFQVELPPALEQFASQMKGDRKKLMKDKAFEEAAQLRSFIGLHLYPRLIKMFEMLAASDVEVYGLAVSNANQHQRMHAWVSDQLDQLGADIDDYDLPGVSPDVLEDFQQAFYALGTLLGEKYPDDKETEGAYNKCASFVAEMVSELMGDYDRDDDRDDDDRDSGTERDDKGDGHEAAKDSPEAKSDDSTSDKSNGVPEAESEPSKESDA